MGVKRRVAKRRDVIDEDTERWLRGERNCGFVEFKPDSDLREIWDRFGDPSMFFWSEGMHKPQAINAER